MAGNPTRQRLDISYLRDPLEILGFDDRHGVGLLHDRAGSLALRGAETLVEYDHLVAAVDRESGVAVAYLGLHDLETADERLIVLGGGFVQDDPAGRGAGAAVAGGADAAGGGDRPGADRAGDVHE